MLKSYTVTEHTEDGDFSYPCAMTEELAAGIASLLAGRPGWGVAPGADPDLGPLLGPADISALLVDALLADSAGTGR
jgi:hypothetical protein